MALSQADRIAHSKKIVQIPIQDQLADETKAILEESRVEAEIADNANKTLLYSDTLLINQYQKELGFIDGNIRRELIESDMLHSANKKLQSDFAPNDIETPLPNIPNGIWVNFAPFSNNLAVGRNYDESFTTTDVNETFSLNTINSLISSLQSNSLTQQTTGQECIPLDPLVGACFPDLGQEDPITCVATPFSVWIPTPDTVQDKIQIQEDMVALIAELANWKTELEGQRSSLQAVNAIDSNLGRVVKNNIEISKINNAISAIDAWTPVATFFTGHGATNCSEFDALNPNTFPPTKMATAIIAPLKAQVDARNIDSPARLSTLSSAEFLGNVAQDYESGEIISTEGLFGSRFRIIDMRLNIIIGTLASLIGIQNGQAAQDEAKASNGNAGIALLSVMSATGFRAPASNTKTIHVLDASSFSAGDVVYVVANTQEEIAANVISIQNNTIFLDAKIPKKYRQDDMARLYKEV